VGNLLTKKRSNPQVLHFWGNPRNLCRTQTYRHGRMKNFRVPSVPPGATASALGVELGASPVASSDHLPIWKPSGAGSAAGRAAETGAARRLRRTGVAGPGGGRAVAGGTEWGGRKGSTGRRAGRGRRHQAERGGGQGEWSQTSVFALRLPFCKGCPKRLLACPAKTKGRVGWKDGVSFHFGKI
jgi:hypothetical protein